MDPLSSAGQAAHVVSDYGTLGAVLLGASIIVAGLMVAVVVLWRSREEAHKAREELQRSHYEWAVAVVARQSDREHEIATSLDAATASMQTIRDLMVQLLGRRDGN